MIGGLFFVPDISPRVYSCSRPRWRSRLLSVCVDEQAGERPLAKWHQGIWESVEMLRRHGVKLVWMWQISVCWQHRHKDPVCGLTQCLLPAGHQSCQADCCSVLVSCIQILCVQLASRSSYHRLQITWECCSSPGFFSFFLWTVYILFVQFKNETFAPTTLNKVTGVRLL